MFSRFTTCNRVNTVIAVITRDAFLYPCEVGADLQLGQRLSDVAAQLGRGGVRLLVVTARVVEGAVDADPHQAQVEVKLPRRLPEDP